jgi:hypothetical protein
MEPKKYATAAAFRRALEDRLQDIARKESVDLQRLRRQVAFDWLLARLFHAAYEALARECGISGQVEDAFAVLGIFLKPILGS